MARVKLGEVAREYKATIKNGAGLPVVGLEHLTPGEITLGKWDVDTENTFTKGFKKGHMLFGRRRAYLKKAALAPFDGICSGDITVIEAIPEKINPELLPFIIQNDLLFDFAVGNSAGSLSPRVKWDSLKEYEFELPELSKQDSLVELLKAAHRAKTAYNQQILATDELVKSQFIEMFGEIDESTGIVQNAKYNFVKLGTLTRIRTGKLDANAAVEGGQYPFFSCAAEPLAIDKFAYDCECVLVAGNGEFNVKYYQGKFEAYQRTYIIESIDSGLTVPFMYWFMLMYVDTLKRQSVGSVIKYIKLGNLTEAQIPLPPIAVQQRFVALAEQSDKSKFELQEAIVRIDNFIKSLIQQDTE